MNFVRIYFFVLWYFVFLFLVKFEMIIYSIIYGYESCLINMKCCSWVLLFYGVDEKIGVFVRMILRLIVLLRYELGWFNIVVFDFLFWMCKVLFVYKLDICIWWSEIFV